MKKIYGKFNEACFPNFHKSSFFYSSLLCLHLVWLSLIKIQHVCQMSDGLAKYSLSISEQLRWWRRKAIDFFSAQNRKCILSIQLRSSITFNQYNFSSFQYWHLALTSHLAIPLRVLILWRRKRNDYFIFFRFNVFYWMNLLIEFLDWINVCFGEIIYHSIHTSFAHLLII